MRGRETNYYGGSTRAADGCIATFELPDGEILVEQFTQLVRTSQKRTWKRASHVEGAPYIEQAAQRADELGARIISLSTPQTILTDLQGTRVPLRAKRLRQGEEPQPSAAVPFPETLMLSGIGRVDLFKRPDSGLQPKQNIRQVRQRKPSHSGRTDQ